MFILKILSASALARYALNVNKCGNSGRSKLKHWPTNSFRGGKTSGGHRRYGVGIYILSSKSLWNAICESEEIKPNNNEYKNLLIPRWNPTRHYRATNKAINAIVMPIKNSEHVLGRHIIVRGGNTFSGNSSNWPGVDLMKSYTKHFWN